MKKSLLILFGPLVLAAGSLQAQTYLNEDFESGSMPAGWTPNPASPAANAWSVPGVTSAYFTPPAHTVYADINDDANQTASNPNQVLNTPVVNLSSATSVYLKYDAMFLGVAPETASIKYSTDGGVTFTTVGAVPANQTGWQTYYVNLTTQLAGQANSVIQFQYNDGAAWSYGFAIDNVSLYTPPPVSAELTSITPAQGSPAAYGAVSSNVNLGGTITNLGATAITSITVKYNDGTSTFTDNISSINIAPFASYTFTHTTPFNIASLGVHPITMWIELASDASLSDDTLGTTINGAAFIPVHHVTVEEGTGTWCGWCVRGMVFMDQASIDHPTDADLIAVHNGDPMVVSAYDAGVGGLISGYPSCIVNRDIVDDPSNIEGQYQATIANFGFADITPAISFNATTRVATVVASAHFAVDLTGDFRLACVFTENDVHNTSGGQWDQHNYYSGGGNGPMNMPGYDFAVLPSVIPSAQMYYDFVARTIVGGFNGQSGSLPATIVAGSTQSYTFNYTIPAGYDVTKMKAIVLLIDNRTGTKHILNSAGGAVPLGIETDAALNGVSVYPNPSNETANVELNLLTSDNVTVEMFDMAGKLISSENEGTLAAGQHIMPLNTAAVANGMYFVKITAGTSVVTTKVSVSH